MDLRKPFFFEHFFSTLCSKRRVLSGFAVGVVASLFVLSLLVSVNTPSSSLFSWFFSVPDVVSHSESHKSVDYLLGVEKYHDGNSSKSSFSGRESDLGNAHFKNLTGDAKNSSSLVNGEPSLEKTHDGNSSKSFFSGKELDMGNALVKNSTEDVKNSSSLVNGEPSLEKTHDGHSSKSSFSGKESDMGIALVKNSTEDVKNSSGLVNQEPVLEKTHEGNFSRNDVRGPEGGKVLGKTHMKNITKDDAKTRVFEKKDGVEGKDLGMKGFNTEGKNVNRSSGEGRVSERIEEDASKNNISGSVKAVGEFSKKCNIFNGRWVRDGRKPYYPAGSCPYIDNDFNCHKNGRPDNEFLRWRWQPNDCSIPSLNATDFLARLRGKRLIFVGDSLNRNMWESLVCILRHGVKRKNRVYEISGSSEFKTKGYYSFRFEDYKCSVDFVRSPFLVRELSLKNSNGSEDEKLRLDLLDETTSAYRQADIIVFNTGHWWTHEKTSRGIDYYQEGDYVYPILKVMEAYKKALTTWARWVDKNINSNKTQVVFRGYSLTHFRGGQWNSGGQCHKETDPIFNEAFLAKYPSKMRALDRVLEQMQTPVIYLNISRLTGYRKDGHPSIYRKKYDTLEEKIAAERSQDCSHWCLPGIPNTWNELLYASLLMGGKGSWR